MMTYNVDSLFFPIVLATKTSPVRATDFAGTGFFIAPSLFVTCWHCVSTPPPPGMEYVIRVRIAEQRFVYFPLTAIEQDQNRTDIATALVDCGLPVHLSLAGEAPHSGQDVWAFGFPYHNVQSTDEGILFTINGRFFKSYLTRAFYHQHHGFPRQLVYELGMPAPLGLSGAPLLLNDTLNVVGMIYGGHDIETITEFEYIDPVTNERFPEVRRIASLGIAHTLATLSSVVTGSTDSLPLSEFLQSP